MPITLPKSNNNTTIRFIGLYFFSFVLFLPFFFTNYRLTAFHTFPFDAYYEYVLYLDGLRDPTVLTSPYAYRIVYYGTGFCFYSILPNIPLSQLPQNSEATTLKALQALAFTAYLYLHAFFFTTFMLLRVRLRRSVIVSVGMGALVVLFSQFAYPTGIDPLYFFYTTLCLLFIQNNRIVLPLLVLSPIVNEKISLIFAVFFFGEFILKKGEKSTLLLFIGSVGSFGLYFLLRWIFDFPVGQYAYQTDIFQFWTRVKVSMPYLTTLKGCYTNWLPLILLSLTTLGCWYYQVFQRTKILLSPTIALLPFFLFVLGVFACSDFSIGRLVMYALPFYIVPITGLLERWDRPQIVSS